MLYNYVWLIPLFPFISFILTLLPQIRQMKGTHKGSYVAIGSMALSAVYSFLILISVIMEGHNFKVYNSYMRWINAGDSSIEIGVMVDQLSAVMLFMVSFVGMLIFIYSRDYMGHDKRFSRFFTYLSLFAASMLGLVIANNFLLLFICWELVGVCSYLLIGFWFEKTSAANAAKKAFITTKIGDLGISIAIMIILWASARYGDCMTLNFFTHDTTKGFFDMLTLMPAWVLTLIALGLFLGAMGKSAQFPLHVWLPDAMEGPTSVSALIHAATMVAAGVYLVGRTYPIFAVPVIPLIVVAFIGAFTAVFAATIAVTANDIKRVLAYSTLSQLGYMMLGLGVGGYTAGLFHLITHAFFKALLFLGSGSVIHGMNGEQDIWKMGGLHKHMKWTCYTFLAGTLCLIGFPVITSGFYSKDEILASAFTFGERCTHNMPSYIPSYIGYLGYIPLLMGLAGVFLTAFYMTRCFTLTFLGNKVRSDIHPHESSPVMYVPLVILAICSILLGAVGIPGMSLFHSFVHFTGVEGMNTGGIYEFGAVEGPNWIVMIISVLLGFAGIGLGYVFYGVRVIKPEETFMKPVLEPVHGLVNTIRDYLIYITTKIPATIMLVLTLLYKLIYTVVKNKYFFDEIYRYCIICVMLMIAQFCYVIDKFIVDKFVDLWAYIMLFISRIKRWIDDHIVDGIAVNGWGYVSIQGGKYLTYLQTGNIQQYIMAICLGIIFLVIIGSVIGSFSSISWLSIK